MRKGNIMRNKYIPWLGTLLLVALLLSAVSCARIDYRTLTAFCMDTSITVQINARQSDATSILNECERILYELDRLLSRTREGSDVWRINHAAVTEQLSPHTVAVIEIAERVSRQTDGAFDITIAPLIELWETCRDRGSLPGEDELSAALALVDYRQLSLDGSTLTKASPEVRIDLGGIAKGYAADVLVEYLKSMNVEYGIVSFGSCIATVGSKPDGAPYRIALRDPSDRSSALGTVTLNQDAVLSVSGDYERGYAVGGWRYHHLLSPTTGYPADSVWHSVAVICKSGAVADALSTALFVRGRFDDKYAAWQGTELSFEGVFTGDAGSEVTAGMEGLFVSSK